MRPIGMRRILMLQHKHLQHSIDIRRHVCSQSDECLINVSPLLGNMTSIEELLAGFKNCHVPTRSKKKYELEFDKFLKFAENIISTDTIKAYMMKCKMDNLSPSTLWTYQSIIRKCSEAQGRIFDDCFWKCIHVFIKDFEKNYTGVKVTAPFFEHAELGSWVNKASTDNPVDLQKVIMVVIAHHGALRCNENHSLTWEVVNINEVKKEVEVTIKSLQSKNGKERRFIITGKKFYELMKDYRSLIDGKIEHFYPVWNVRFRKFSNQRRGPRGFQTIPKEIAAKLGLSNPEKYSHHSFRKGSASAAFTKDATLEQIKRICGWDSSTVALSYCHESDFSKRNISEKIAILDESTNASRKRKYPVVEEITEKKARFEDDTVKEIEMEVNEEKHLNCVVNSPENVLKKKESPELDVLTSIFKNCNIKKIGKIVINVNKV